MIGGGYTQPRIFDRFPPGTQPSGGDRFPDEGNHRGCGGAGGFGAIRDVMSARFETESIGALNISLAVGID